jgi:hypothetical protein
MPTTPTLSTQKYAKTSPLTFVLMRVRQRGGWPPGHHREQGGERQKARCEIGSEGIEREGERERERERDRERFKSVVVLGDKVGGGQRFGVQDANNKGRGMLCVLLCAPSCSPRLTA